jgi:hypothetical protein
MRRLAGVVPGAIALARLAGLGSKDGRVSAFIRELVRKSALAAADKGDLTLRDRHVDQALHELLIHGGGLTRSLLGATATAAA